MSDPIAGNPGRPEILMYSTRMCGYCDRARALFVRRQLPYSEIKVDEDPAALAAMLERSGGRRTVPQIFIGERHVGGFTDMVQLDRTGELDRLLGSATPVAND